MGMLPGLLLAAVSASDVVDAFVEVGDSPFMQRLCVLSLLHRWWRS